uniref:Uncharacterized protein n=1 Tax=Anopheles maculatus TaxID=74869 RepID=A0A182SFE3_9DIPT
MAPANPKRQLEYLLLIITLCSSIVLSHSEFLIESCVLSIARTPSPIGPLPTYINLDGVMFTSNETLHNATVELNETLRALTAASTSSLEVILFCLEFSTTDKLLKAYVSPDQLAWQLSANSRYSFLKDQNISILSIRYENNPQQLQLWINKRQLNSTARSGFAVTLDRWKELSVFVQPRENDPLHEQLYNTIVK